MPGEQPDSRIADVVDRGKDDMVRPESVGDSERRKRDVRVQEAVKLMLKRTGNGDQAAEYEINKAIADLNEDARRWLEGLQATGNDGQIRALFAEKADDGTWHNPLTGIEIAPADVNDAHSVFEVGTPARDAAYVYWMQMRAGAAAVAENYPSPAEPGPLPPPAAS